MANNFSLKDNGILQISGENCFDLKILYPTQLAFKREQNENFGTDSEKHIIHRLSEGTTQELLSSKKTKINTRLKKTWDTGNTYEKNSKILWLSLTAAVAMTTTTQELSPR